MKRYSYPRPLLKCYVNRLLRCVLYTQTMFRLSVLLSLPLMLGPVCSAQVAGDFPPLEQWHMAILRGDTAELSSLYSVSPPAEIKTGSGAVDLNAEYAFWT